ncbi:MAG: serine/threonine protein kinase [Actinobacteria bacterium]|nr:serine/threonine protein kinase [Actinomycetota bacterium]
MTPGPTTVADGRYELVRRIGRGASGEVWLAEDTRLRRQVAIKRADIPEYLGDAEQARIRRRLEREARAAARLRRPGVAPLFDVHVSDDGVDLVMAYIDAPTLHQLVAEEGPLPDARVAEIGLTILSVLEEAHGQGVVHRDIKPSNVLVSDDGVKVTDFGIAAILDETALTRTGMAMGSPSYIAPEQAKGDDPAPTADLWGLGATLYYALTGVAPFDRQRAIATVHAVVNEPHEPLDGSHALGDVIDRLLAKDPADRPSVPEIRTAFERVLAGDGASGGETEPERDATAVLTPARTVAAPAGSQPPVDVQPTVASPPVRTGPDEPPAPAPARAPARPPAGDGASPWGRRLGIAAAVLLLAVVGVLVLTSGDPTTDLGGVAVEDDTAAGGEAAPDAGAAPAGEDADAGGEGVPAPAGATERVTDTATDAAAEATEDPEATGDEPPDAAVPDGWERVAGETWSVAVPAGWEVRDASGPRVDLVDPASGAYLRVDWTDSPKADPEADWQEQSEAFAARHDDYRELRIEEVDYADAAAIWEYTYRAGGAALHAYNLGFVAGARGYALNFQTRADDWEAMEPMFEDFLRTFRPT